MGCDIHIHYEKKVESVWEQVDSVKPLRVSDLSKYGMGNFEEYPLDYRSYKMFALLADVRNYHDVLPISRARGLPTDVSKKTLQEFSLWESDYHNSSWFLLEELLPYKNSLDDDFFKSVEILEESGVERVVFWFDN